MKRLLVHVRDDKGTESVLDTDPMDDEAAEAERKRVEREHAAAGPANTWIRFGRHSVQSRDIFRIEIADDVVGASGYFGDDDEEPPFTRGMSF